MKTIHVQAFALAVILDYFDSISDSNPLPSSVQEAVIILNSDFVNCIANARRDRNRSRSHN